MISESVNKLVDEFAKLPGIGKKSAERLAYHILRVHQSEALALAEAIRSVKENVRYCRTCYNLTEQESARFAATGGATAPNCAWSSSRAT